MVTSSRCAVRTGSPRPGMADHKPSRTAGLRSMSPRHQLRDEDASQRDPCPPAPPPRRGP